MQILLILILELLTIIGFSRVKHPNAGMMLFICLNLLAVSLTGEVDTNYGFGISNVGNLYYAFVLQSVAILNTKKHETAINSIIYCALAIIAFFLLRFIAIYFNTVNPETEITAAYRTVIDSAGKYLIASLTAFGASSLFLIGLLEVLKLPLRVKYLIAITAAEIIDSFIFYAFLRESWSNFIEFIAVGFPVKCLIHVAFLPVFLWLTQDEQM